LVPFGIVTVVLFVLKIITLISPLYPESTVPGVFRTVNPWFIANPLLGLT
jgi:hypothetical protein